MEDDLLHSLVIPIPILRGAFVIGQVVVANS